GTISYAPKANLTGTDFFHYTIQDIDGQTSTGTVNITVNPLNDAPTQAGSLAYTVVQASVLQILAAGGIASEGFDADGDTITVIQDTVPASLGLGFPGTTLGVLPDGAFLYTPDATFVGTDSFVIRLFDGATFSAPITVTIEVTAAPLPPPPPPPGKVEFDFDLANVPLEDAVSAEANVLVIMDDSGSMDWALMTDGSEGQFWLTNAGIKDPGTGTSTREYRYLVPLASNVYGNDRILPTETALAADPVFLGNNYGVWRGRNSQYNTIYYNPQIQYKPWVGLNRSNVDFPNASATAALLDPYEAPPRTINLTNTLTYISNNVPRLHGGGSSRNLTNAARDPAMTYPGGPNRLDCAVSTACTYAEEIQNFANWFTYYRSREYTAKAALGRTVADVTNIRLGYVVLNDTNERTAITSMNASYRVGNKLAMMNQIYKIDSNNGTPLRLALDRAGKYFECRAGGSFGSPNTTPGDARCPVLPSPEGQCQNNFALLFSDGTWNESFTIGANGNAARNNDVATSSPFDGGKYGDA
ncbi:MAG: Ig-like domain-containing protein, partial [Proteobacteria bacterium]|nr:Ig-like domain-containing protein [Pseudomonadota bacterium]